MQLQKYKMEEPQDFSTIFLSLFRSINVPLHTLVTASVYHSSIRQPSTSNHIKGAGKTIFGNYQITKTSQWEGNKMHKTERANTPDSTIQRLPAAALQIFLFPLYQTVFWINIPHS